MERYIDRSDSRDIEPITEGSRLSHVWDTTMDCGLRKTGVQQQKKKRAIFPMEEREIQ